MTTNKIVFYSNENFPIDMVIALRQLGHEALTSYDAGQANQGISDDRVLLFAKQHGLATITLNREDFINLHRSGLSHSGIIICKNDRDYVEQVQTLHTYLQTQGRLDNRLIRIQKENSSKLSKIGIRC